MGRRQATNYGKQLTEQLIAELAPYRPIIISGLAYGIDIAAHRAALRLGLPTLGVMASGLDIIYPAPHKNTATEMLGQGGGLSPSMVLAPSPMPTNSLNETALLPAWLMW